MIKQVFLKLKEHFLKLHPYHMIVVFVSICMLIAIFILGIVLDVGRHSLPDQMMAERWSEKNDVAQISCFYSEDAYVTEESIAQMRYSLEKQMREQALTPNTANARLYMDAYSAKGSIFIQSDKKSIQATAIGIGGDFFRFHPVKLLSGMYFSGNDLMQDSILLDEEAAWQLFGSNDIAGRTVIIGGIPYRIAGVYEREQGDLETMAGSEDTTVYISYSALNRLNNCAITCYEIVLPNPVEGYGMDLVLKCNAASEDYVKLIENSNRFSYLSLYKVWKERASRTMKTDNIVLPFWENLARVKEETMMEVALWQVSLLCILAVYWSVRLMRFIIRHKPDMETFTRIWDNITDKVYRFRRKRKEKKALKKEKKGKEEKEPVSSIVK